MSDWWVIHARWDKYLWYFPDLSRSGMRCKMSTVTHSWYIAAKARSIQGLFKTKNWSCMRCIPSVLAQREVLWRSIAFIHPTMLSRDALDVVHYFRRFGSIVKTIIGDSGGWLEHTWGDQLFPVLKNNFYHCDCRREHWSRI